MDATKTVAATTIGIPVVVLLLLILLVAVDDPVTCAMAPSAAAGMGGETGASVAGLSESQLRLARDGVVIGIRRGMPETVIVAELAAQATESSFRNLANANVPESLNYANDGIGADHDSVGPHQMRVSIWGEVGIATLMNPVYQINWFYDRAAALGAAVTQMSPAELAQTIERSAPNAYVTQLDLARHLYAMFADIDPGPVAPGPQGGAAPGCGASGSGAPLTAQDSEFGRAVIEHAERWLGFPYVWGGGDTHGPTDGGFDCSGLTLYAIYHASQGQIWLPHYTQAQQDHPSAQAIPFDRKAPGDLIFLTSPGSSDSHHVGIYYGRDEYGEDLLLHAPTTGQNVTVTPLSGWAGEQMDVRRYTPPGGGERGQSPEPGPRGRQA
ncbi:C40 family peptidase [Nocardia sputi]|uniref:C40 family peptidase n=1 Tax=Nocardia sputi TaxID=2943705 RepID=UPI0020BDEACE|nr:C40 family peptidase [Nocardia sputi]